MTDCAWTWIRTLPGRGSATELSTHSSLPPRRSIFHAFIFAPGFRSETDLRFSSSGGPGRSSAIERLHKLSSLPVPYRPGGGADDLILLPARLTRDETANRQRWSERRHNFGASIVTLARLPDRDTLRDHPHARVGMNVQEVDA